MKLQLTELPGTFKLNVDSGNLFLEDLFVEMEINWLQWPECIPAVNLNILPDVIRSWEENWGKENGDICITPLLTIGVVGR
jgi:hypothetical protein